MFQLKCHFDPEGFLFGLRLPDNVTTRNGGRNSFGSLEQSFRLDDKMQYAKLLETVAKHETNDASLYSTPIGKFFHQDSANMSRSGKILTTALAVHNKEFPGQ